VRKEDLELSRADIQLLSSRDALAAFFAELGCDTKESQHRIFMNNRLYGFLLSLVNQFALPLEKLQMLSAASTSSSHSKNASTPSKKPKTSTTTAWTRTIKPAYLASSIITSRKSRKSQM
jgi:hypothetical protein